MVFLTRTVGHVFVTPRVMTSFALHHSSDTAMANGFTMQLASLPTNAQTVTVPALTGDDTFVFADHAQTLTNKTLTSAALSDATLTGTTDLEGVTLDAGTGATLTGTFSGGTFEDATVSGTFGLGSGTLTNGSWDGNGATTLTNMELNTTTMTGPIVADGTTLSGTIAAGSAILNGPTIRRPLGTWHERVRFVRDTNIDVSNATGSTIDGTAWASITNGDRILLTGQTDTTENGIYTKSNSTLARAADLGTGNCDTGVLVAVQAGGVYANQVFMMSGTAMTVNVGTDTMSWSAVTGTGITANSTHTLTNKTIDVAGTGNVITLFERVSTATSTIPQTLAPRTTGWTLYQVDAASGARVLNLPSASGFNALLTFADTGSASVSNTITINADGSDTINGSSSFEINAPFNTITIMSSGASAWRTI